MDLDRQRRRDELLEVLLDLEPAARAEYLAAASEHDPELRADVEQVLAMEAQVGDDFLEAGAASAAPWPLPAGTHLGRFVIEGVIGAGGMSTVYLAQDPVVGRKVAIKVMSASHDDAWRDRFVRELRILGGIRHDHVVGVYDFGETPDGHPFLVMEYLDGEDLSTAIARGHMRDRAIKIDIARQIAVALRDLHRLGIVHRDLKPANVMLDPSGRVKLIDFGIARTDRAAATEVGLLRGTPEYMAPERITGGEATPRVDIYAYGVLLFELFSGKRPFSGSTEEVLQLALREPIALQALRGKAPPRIVSLIARATAKNPNERPPDGDAIVAMLERKPRWIRVAGVAALLAVVVIGMVFGRMAFRRSGSSAGMFAWRSPVAASPLLTERDVLVVADFSNQTEDPVFDTALKQALAFQLQESPYLKAMDDMQLRAALAGSGRSADSRVTADVARDLCVREGEKATLEGGIAQIGSEYLLTLQAVNCTTGETLAREQTNARRKDDVVQALADAMSRMRVKLGESLSSIDRQQRLYKNRVTTTSLEALQAFYMGDAEWVKSGDTRAVFPYYERATQLDPNFAMAWAILALRYQSVGDSRLYRDCLTKAYELIDNVSERERVFITSEYMFMTGEPDRGLTLREVLVRTYPRDPMLHYNLALGYLQRGRWQEALHEAEATLDIGPNMVQGYAVAASALRELNRIDEAVATYRRAIAAGFDTAQVHGGLLYVALATDDAAAQRAELEWFSMRPPNPGALRNQANDAVARGRLKTARTFYRRAQSAVQQFAPVANASRYSEELRTALALVGRCREARAGTAIRIVDALCGSNETLREFAEAPDRSGPEAYARAAALLNTGRAADALAAFDEMLKRRVPNWGPEYPAALVGKARAAVALGDRSTARTAYEALVALWRDADPDIPLLLAARREYKALAP